jgi:hypothetical protein
MWLAVRAEARTASLNDARDHFQKGRFEKRMRWTQQRVSYRSCLARVGVIVLMLEESQQDGDVYKTKKH